MMALRDYTTICSSAPSEVLTLMALRSQDAVLATNRERVLRNRETAAAFFARRSDTLAWIQPRAGTVCFPRLRIGRAEAFCAQVLRDTGVLLLPSTVYGYGDSHFRMGLGRDDFGAGLEVLDAYL